MRLLRGMWQQSLFLDAVTYTTAPSLATRACEIGPNCEDMFRLLPTMSQGSLIPDALSHNVAMCACEKRSQW